MLISATAVHAEWNSAVPLPAPRWYPGCCAYGEHLYVTGGEQGGQGHYSVWYSQVQEDGSLEPWLSTTLLPGGRMYHGCVAYNGYMYVAGGWGYGSYHATVWYAQIQGDGSIGSWISTTDMPAARDGIGLVAHDGYLYTLGRYNGSSDSRAVWFVPIQGDGSLGSWESTTDIPAVRRCHGACAYDGYLYLTGGFTMGAIPTGHDDVWFAEVQGDGSIASWVSTTPLPDARYGHPCCAHNEHLLVTGGQSAFSYYNTAWYGEIQGDGTVASWPSMDDLPESRTGHGCCVCNDYLYVIGGVNSSGNLATVRYSYLGTPAGLEIDTFQAKDWSIQLKARPIAASHHVEIEYRIASTHGNDVIPVNLDLYDASGRSVRTLVDGKLPEGTYHTHWRPRRSGLYLLRLSTPFATETEKVVAIR